MTALTAAFLRHWPRSDQTSDRTAPARPDAGPVLIQDAITGANHSTLLHQLWRRWDENRNRDHRSGD